MSWQRLGMVLLLGFQLVAVTPVVAATQVNINNADADTLVQHIVGVGPKKAEAIVAYRKTHGPFKTIEDLSKVKGIGHRLIERNRNILTTSSISNHVITELIAQKTH